MRGCGIKRIVAIAAGLAGVAVLLAVSVGLAVVTAQVAVSCRGNPENGVDTEGLATIGHPVVSPSGKYQLEVIEETIEGVRHNRFTIFRVSNGETEAPAMFTAHDAYRTRDMLHFLWDDEDRVWVYSGDVGTFFWERVSDDNWQKYEWADHRSVPVPSLLKELEPRSFEGLQ